VSRGRYWVRRLGVLALVGVLAFALVRAVGGLLGGGDGTADADGDGAIGPVVVADESGSDSADPGGGDDPVDAGTGSQASPDTGSDAGSDAGPDAEGDAGPPTPSNPAKVYIVGDSDAGTFGPYLETLLDQTNLVETELNYKVSSGLARPDFFDWPEELRATVPEVDPDIVVVTFGGNDGQGLSKPQDELEFLVGDPVANREEWTAEYTARVNEVLDILQQDGRHVIWVGIPNDDNPEVTERMAVQDQAVRAAIADHPGVVFIDTWARFSGRNGGWAEFVVDPRDGQGKDVRADDGFHLNENGAEILALDIAVAVQDHLRALGAAI
jgi:hypothetical protein